MSGSPSRPARSWSRTARGPTGSGPDTTILHELAEGRVAELAPAGQLADEELLHPVPGRKRDRVSIRLVGLHEDSPGCVPPTPPGELRDELKRPLLGAKVRHPEPGVGVHDGGEGNAGEMVALCHHLGAEKDGAVGRRKPGQLVAEERRIGDGVRVQTDQLEVRKLLGQLCFQVLGTGPEAGQLGRAADRAAVRRVGREAAVVAVEPSVAMEGEGDVTLVAAEGLTAGAAMDRRCHSAAVQEEHGLAAACPRAGRARRGAAPRAGSPPHGASRRP